MTFPVYDPPADVEVAAPFWEAIQRGELRLPRCSRCHRWQWYPDAAGPDCADATLEWVAVPLSGVLHTFTRVYRPFLPGDGASVPYVIGFVELDDVTGVRLVANIADDENVAIGRRVRATFVDAGGQTRPVFTVLDA